jgi:hypothetical protein
MTEDEARMTEDEARITIFTLATDRTSEPCVATVIKRSLRSWPRSESLKTYTPQAKGNTNPGNVFRKVGFSYMHNLDTTGIAPGKYTLPVKAGNDPVFHPFTFMIAPKPGHVLHPVPCGPRRAAQVAPRRRLSRED